MINKNSKSNLYFLDGKEKACVMDNKSIVFWRNGIPSLEFMESNVITYQGINLLFLRPDIDIEDLQVYILTYYRILTPDTIVKNLKNLTKDDIKSRYIARVGKAGVGKAIVLDNNPKPYGCVPFNYQPIKEIAAFKKQNAGRYLACMVLSKSYSGEFLPYDPYDAKRFFEENFKDSVEEVFDKYCESRKENKSELLSYYRNIAERNRSKYYYEKVPEKKFSTVDLLASAFLQIAK